MKRQVVRAESKEFSFLSDFNSLALIAPLTTPTSLRVWMGLFNNSRIFLIIFCCHYFSSKCLSCSNKVFVFIVMFTGMLYSICTKPLSLSLLLQGWGLVPKRELFCNCVWEPLKVYPWRYVFVCLIIFKSSKWKIEGMYYEIFITLLIYEISEISNKPNLWFLGLDIKGYINRHVTDTFKVEAN